MPQPLITAARGALVGAVAAALVLIAAAAGARIAARGGVDPLATIELKSYDWRLVRTARPETARRDLVLVEIDEYSLRNLQTAAGRWPWPRIVHAELLDYLSRGPATLIVYDVNFAEPDSRLGFRFGEETLSGAESDAALVESVRAAGNVILLADATYQGAADAPPLPDEGYRFTSPGIMRRSVIFPPFPAVAAAAAGFGHNLFVFDPDGPLRHTVPFVASGTRAVPSLGAAAALRVAGLTPDRVALQETRLTLGDRELPLSWRTVETQAGLERYLWGLLNFRGPALLADLKSRPYTTYSFFDLLVAEEQIRAGLTPDIDPARFRDAVVFVGASGSGLADAFETPFARGRMPGVQVHAAAADDILSGRFLRPAGEAARIATVIAAALAVGIVAVIVPAWWATGVVIALMALGGWASTRLFADGYWLNITQPVLASACALFGGVGYQYLVEGREKRKMKRLFGRYVSKDVYQQLVANPSLARLGGQRREMTVLFSDIRGFTSLSEKSPPEDIVDMLNEYFTRMVAIVFRHNGTVDKFVGDMVMALFGAPLDDPEHADHAVAAALEMVAELDALNTKWGLEGRPPLDIGIGINSGPMIAGNIGSDALMSYTVIGDAVNLGARLESLNKQYSTRLIISEATRARLTRPFACRPLGDVVVKGKNEPVAIFEVTPRTAVAEAQV